jgi:hypothetical protein
MRAKAMALTGMAGGYVVFYLAASPGIWLALFVGLLIGGCAFYVGSRPLPSASAPSDADRGTPPQKSSD